jgi:exoribonuclease R
LIFGQLTQNPPTSSILGEIGDKEIETGIILNELGISKKEFSTAVMACLPPNSIGPSRKSVLSIEWISENFPFLL